MASLPTVILQIFTFQVKKDLLPPRPLCALGRPVLVDRAGTAVRIVRFPWEIQPGVIGVASKEQTLWIMQHEWACEEEDEDELVI